MTNANHGAVPKSTAPITGRAGARTRSSRRRLFCIGPIDSLSSVVQVSSAQQKSGVHDQIRHAPQDTRAMRSAPVALAFAGVAITEAQQCTTATGVSVGAGFIKELKGVASAAECCTECFDFGYGCTGFTFDTSGTGDCFLKDNTSGSTPTANRTSGAPGAGPRPPTPADNRTVATRACLAPRRSRAAGRSLDPVRWVDIASFQEQNDDIFAHSLFWSGGSCARSK